MTYLSTRDPESVTATVTVPSGRYGWLFLYTAPPCPSDIPRHEATYPGYVRQQISTPTFPRTRLPDGSAYMLVVFPRSTDGTEAITHYGLFLEGDTVLTDTGALVPLGQIHMDSAPEVRLWLSEQDVRRPHRIGLLPGDAELDYATLAADDVTLEESLARIAQIRARRPERKPGDMSLSTGSGVPSRYEARGP